MVYQMLGRRVALLISALSTGISVNLELRRLWPAGEGLLRNALRWRAAIWAAGGGDQYGYGPGYSYACQAPNFYYRLRRPY
jgi:hypothetical protein